MKCDRCSDNILFVKPINTCTTINGWEHELTTYVLCNKCLDELKKFIKRNVSLDDVFDDPMNSAFNPHDYLVDIHP